MATNLEAGRPNDLNPENLSVTAQGAGGVSVGLPGDDDGDGDGSDGTFTSHIPGAGGLPPNTAPHTLFGATQPGAPSYGSPGED